jgi:hypothetical protein
MLKQTVRRVNKLIVRDTECVVEIGSDAILKAHKKLGLLKVRGWTVGL